MHQKVRRGLDTLDKVCDEAQAVARMDRGHIRVGTLASLAVGIVTRTPARLKKDFPGITVSMREDFNDALVDLVAAGETDLSVCSEIGPRPGLVFSHLFDDELMLVSRRGTRLASQRVVDWATLAEAPLVLTGRRTATRQHVLAGSRRTASPRKSSTRWRARTAMAMVREGFGSAFVSRVALAELDTSGLTVARMREPPLRRMDIYRRADRPPSPAGARFEQELRREAARTAQRLGLPLSSEASQ